MCFPTGYFTNVEDKPGKWAVSGKWRGQWALPRVHFAACTKRPSELFLGFVDYGTLSPQLDGVFVVTLQLPLTCKRNLFEQTPRYTKIEDVRGWSDIDHSAMPWPGDAWSQSGYVSGCYPQKRVG